MDNFYQPELTQNTNMVKDIINWTLSSKKHLIDVHQKK